MAEQKKDDASDDDGLSGVADFVQIYMISVDIIAAHNVEKADVFGKSDPYCRVTAMKTQYSTCTIMKTLNPVWNEHVELTFFNDPKFLRFEVFDWDKGSKDDPIGDCQFDLNGLYDENSAGFKGKIKLQNAKTGELEIAVVARKLLPLELEQRLDSLQDLVAKNEATIASLDQSIVDQNNKISALEQENNQINANITSLTADVPKREQELSEAEQQSKQLSSQEMDVLNNEIDEAKQKYIALEGEVNRITKEVEDVRVAEDKKHTENEHLRNDIKDLKRQIQEKKEMAERAQKEKEAKEEKEQLLKKEREEKEKEEEKKRKDRERKEIELKQKEEEKQLQKESQLSPSKSDQDTDPMLGSTQNKDKNNNASTSCSCCTVL